MAYEGVPKTKRHPKSSQASATPVTDGRHVIVSFGSRGTLRLRLRRQAAVEEGSRRPERRLVLRSRLRVGHRQLADHLQEHGDRAVRHPARLVPRRVRHRHRQGGLAHAARRDSVVVDADDLRSERQGRARHAGDDVHARLRPDDGQGAVEILGQLRDRDPDADRRPRLRRSSPTAIAACSRSSRSSPARPATSR